MINETIIGYRIIKDVNKNTFYVVRVLKGGFLGNILETVSPDFSDRKDVEAALNQIEAK